MPKKGDLVKEVNGELRVKKGVPKHPVVDADMNRNFFKSLDNELRDHDPMYTLFSSVCFRDRKPGNHEVSLRVSPRHKASWVIFYRPKPGASERTYKLGDYELIRHDQAVKLAGDARNAISEGLHPRDAYQKKEFFEGPTLAQCLEEKIEARGVKPPRPKGLAQSTIDTHRKHMKIIRQYGLANKPMTEITSGEVQELHDRIHTDIRKRGGKRGDGYATAAKVINLINEMYRFAEKNYVTNDVPQQKVIKHNPAEPMKVRKQVGGDHRAVTASDRAIRQVQLKPFWHALEELKTYESSRYNKEVKSHIIAHGYLKFILLTGMRGGAVSNLKFRMYDAKYKEFNIIGDDKYIMKADNEFILPLSEEAAQIVEDMRAHHGNASEYVFPQVNLKKPAPIGVPEWVQYLRHKTKINFTSHGLRSTYITCAETCDAPVNIYKRLVDHGNQPHDITSRYARTEIETMRKHTQKITDFILENAGVKKKKKEPVFTADANPFDIKDELHEEIEGLATDQGKTVKEMYEICLKLGSLVHQFPEVKAEKLINMMRLL